MQLHVILAFVLSYSALLPAGFCKDFIGDCGGDRIFKTSIAASSPEEMKEELMKNDVFKKYVDHIATKLEEQICGGDNTAATTTVPLPPTDGTMDKGSTTPKEVPPNTDINATPHPATDSTNDSEKVGVTFDGPTSPTRDTGAQEADHSPNSNEAGSEFPTSQTQNDNGGCSNGTCGGGGESNNNTVGSNICSCKNGYLKHDGECIELLPRDKCDQQYQPTYRYYTDISSELTCPNPEEIHILQACFIGLNDGCCRGGGTCLCQNLTELLKSACDGNSSCILNMTDGYNEMREKLERNPRCVIRTVYHCITPNSSASRFVEDNWFLAGNGLWYKLFNETTNYTTACNNCPGYRYGQFASPGKPHYALST